MKMWMVQSKQHLQWLSSDKNPSYLANTNIKGHKITTYTRIVTNKSSYFKDPYHHKDP